MNSGINVFALPAPPPLPSGPIADTPEARAASWIIATENLGSEQAKVFKLRPDEHQKLDDIRFHLVNYLRSIEHPGKGNIYALAPGAHHSLDAAPSRGAALEALFAPVLGGGRTNGGLALQCTALATKPAQEKPKVDPTASRWIVRGKIDDLAVPRFNPGTSDDSDAFKKAAEAKVGFTDNGVKGEEAVTADIAMGYGWQLTPNDALIGFVHYTQNSTETRNPSDDDDSKDVRAVSPGFLYRRTIGGEGHRLVGSFGATVFSTYDLAQDARIVRARFFLNDITIRRNHAPALCGSEVPWGGDKPWLYFSCRLGVFAEYGHIIEPGRNVDFAAPDDDDYTGLGGTVGLSFALARPESLAPFTFTAEYRYLHVFDSNFGDDPERFVLELAYKIPKSNLSIGLSRTFGENNETFQHEDLNKLSIGFKY
jgi:hypothetical protein